MTDWKFYGMLRCLEKHELVHEQSSVIMVLFRCLVPLTVHLSHVCLVSQRFRNV